MTIVNSTRDFVRVIDNHKGAIGESLNRLKGSRESTEAGPDEARWTPHLGHQHRQRCVLHPLPWGTPRVVLKRSGMRRCINAEVPERGPLRENRYLDSMNRRSTTPGRELTTDAANTWQHQWSGNESAQRRRYLRDLGEQIRVNLRGEAC